MSEQSLLPWVQRSLRPMGRPSLSALQESVDSLFEDFTQHATMWPSPMSGEGNYLPRIDFCEEDDKYLLTADLPGVKKEDLSIVANSTSLTIKGEKSAEKEKSGRHFYRKERSHGRFYRAMPIPDDADPDKIQASFRDGVLTVEIARTNSGKSGTRKIAIQN